VRKIFNSLGSLLGVAALIVFVIALALVFRSQGEEKIAWQPPTAPTPVPAIKNIRMSDTPGGPAVINFPSRASSLYVVFEYAQVQDTPVAVRTYDSVGNVLFEQTQNYSGEGMETIGVASRAGVFADGRYITNIYVGSELFVVKTLMWAVGEELPTPTPTVRPTTILTPTVVPPTPAIPVTPVAMQTYISKTLITAKVGNGPGEIGIMPEMPERPASGPPSFTVDKEGNIYILDGYNTRVAKFDSQGTFLVNIPYEQPLAAGDIAVDNERLIYLLDRGLYGPDSASITQRVKLYDQKGNLIREYFKPDWMEQMVWIGLDENGHVLAEGKRKGEPRPVVPLPANVPIGWSVVTLGNAREAFSHEQQLATERIGRLFGGNITVTRCEFSEELRELHVYDQSGSLFLKLPVGRLDGSPFIGFFGEDRGGIWYVAVAYMTPGGEPKRKMLRFNSGGNLIATFTMPDSYYAHPSRSIVIDDAGNVYDLLCYSDRINVTKWEKQ
jgi:hypothetical protein